MYIYIGYIYIYQTFNCIKTFILYRLLNIDISFLLVNYNHEEDSLREVIKARAPISELRSTFKTFMKIAAPWNKISFIYSYF